MGDPAGSDLATMAERIESDLATMAERSESDNYHLARFQSQEIYPSYIYLIHT